MRGHGVYYSEILGDVCWKVGVKRQYGELVEQWETNLLAMILAQSIEKMSPSERAELQATFQSAGVKNLDFSVGIPATIFAARIAVHLTGFLKYQIAVIVANAVARTLLGRGLSFAANAALTRYVGVLFGPIGIAVTSLWTAYDAAGPAYRVTIPCCCHIAFLRRTRYS